MVTLAGPWPAWIGQCDDRVLQTRLGAGTLSRGTTYARQRAVLTLTVVGDGQVLSASVRGSGRRSYQTIVKAQAPRSGARVDFSGHCSCPMQVDCKHVAAALITARGLAAPARPAAILVVSWETQLAGLLQAPEPEASLPSIGLQLEVVTPPSPNGGTPARASRLRLRAVTPGKNGRWIRTGMGWRDLQHGYGYSSVKVRPEQRDVLRTLLASFRARQPAYASSYSEPQIHLDDVGPGAWRWLVEAEQAGIALVAISAKQQVLLDPDPATVVMDLRQAGPEQDAELSMLVRVPGEDLPAEGLVLVGSPAHGAYVATTELLRLIPFGRAIDPVEHRLLTGGGLRIPASDVPVFLGRYYPRLRQRLTVESGDASVELPEIEPPRLALHVRFEPEHQTLLEWSFAYPVAGQLILVHGEDEQVARDRSAEQDLLAGLPELPGLGSDESGRRCLAPQALVTGIATALFVQDVLPALMARDGLAVTITGTPADYVQADDAPLITVSAHDSKDGSTDWFDLAVDVSVGGQDVPLTMLLVALAQEQEHLLLHSGTWFRLDRPELQVLRRLIEEARSLQDKESTGLRLTAFHAGLWEELVSLGVVEHQSARWTQRVSALLELDQLPQPEPPAMLEATLRPYQLEGFHWLSLLWDHQLGGVLADDMGLGKTVQTLAMVARAREQGTLGGSAGPLLVVAPTSVVGTWASEAARFVPDLSVVAITETQNRSGQVIADVALDADLVITSYALFRIDEDACREVSWSGLVLDEAQFVKNRQAKTYQVARRLPAPFKLAITGTPLENSLMDLWSMLSITAPGLFPNPQRFTELFRKPIESGESPEQLAVLRRRIRPLMLRRTKEQVATDLPPKIEQVLEVTLNPQHRKVYDKHLARERQRVLGLLDDLQRNRIAILRSLTVLRQLSLDASLVDAQHAGKIRSSKIDVLLEQLCEVVAEGHRVLVFSQFTSFLALVRARLVEEGIGHCYLDGRTRDRPRRIAEFTDGDDPVFLISLKAGGVGLTLTEADYVFVLDPWWNPAAEAQAVDRAHRIGQSKTVMVYRLVATGTIEEKVVALQQRKRDLFARVVDDDAMTGSAMTADDIRGLFT